MLQRLMICWSLFLTLGSTFLLAQRLPAFQMSGGKSDPSLVLRGQIGSTYSVLTSTNLADPNGWKLADSVRLTSRVQPWVDRAGFSGKSRYYRALLEGNHPAAAWINDFRLIDHTDRTQSLYYYSKDSASVLLFFDPTCHNLDEVLLGFQALHQTFSGRNIRFWGIARGNGNLRESLRTLARVKQLTFPLMQDQTGILTADCGVQHSGEVVAVRTDTFGVFYQGDIASHPPAGSGNPIPWLANSLNAFLNDQNVAPLRMPAIGCPLELGSSEIPDYAKVIAPILLNRCVHCHSVGNIGSWVMKNYETIQRDADSIKTELVAGRMPPWHADPHYSKFSNDMSLSDLEKTKLVAWIEAGAPRGTGPDPLTNSVTTGVDWPLGAPDAILTIPLQSLPEDGLVGYRYINLVNPFKTNVWLKAAVIKPGNRRVVHHALVFASSNPWENLGGLAGYFAGYVPGQDSSFFPDGTAKKLLGGVTLQFQMHYITTGQPETDQTQIGLYLAKSGGTAPRELFTKTSYNPVLSIPPYSPETIVTGLSDFQFAKRSTIYELTPHMHLRGSWFRYELIYPDNTKEVLLSVPRYEFHWQTLYRLSQPKVVPAGTKLHCVGAFDNSELNAENPDPSQSVKFGEQTMDEMFIGYFNYAETP